MNSKRRTALTVWMSMYPLITLIFWLFGPFLMEIPLPLRTLCVSFVMVPMMVWVLLPFWGRIFKRFLD